MRLVNLNLGLVLLLFTFAAFRLQGKESMVMNEKEQKTRMVFPVKHISVTINRSADEVYRFASKYENLPQWAAGLSGSIRKVGTIWVADSPMGKVEVEFAPDNPFGILDHKVTLPSGEAVYNPMRVIPNNEGCEVVFTLYQLPGRSTAEFVKDAGMVEKDLNRLKQIMEQ
jgi:uncharacterized membrane protein